MSKLFEGYGDWKDVVVVKISELHIDETYQRPRNRQKVGKIAKSFDIDLAGIIVVNERGGRGAGRKQKGKLFVVDGGHRLEGAKKAGEEEMLAHMFRGLSREEESHLYRQLNTLRGPVKAMDRFKAKLTEKDPDALEIVRIVRTYDSDVNTMPNESHGINAIEALERIYGRDKGAALGAVLSVVRGAWGTVDTPMGTAKVLKGIDWFLRHHDHFDRKRLLRRLKEEGVASLGRKAAAFITAYGGADWVGFYLAIVETYNHRLVDSRRLMPISPARQRD